MTNLFCTAKRSALITLLILMQPVFASIPEDPMDIEQMIQKATSVEPATPHIFEEYVYSKDGIPVYYSADTKEESICGRLPYGTVLRTQDLVRSDLKKVISIREVQLPECGNRQLYVPTGFLSPTQYASTHSSVRQSRSWKSEVPQFDIACKEQRGNNKIILTFVGDILLHGALQRQAYSQARGFETLWEQLEPTFQQADIAYANLEGPTGTGVNCRGQITSRNQQLLEADCRKQNSSVYTSYPRFNYHPRLNTDLVNSGFDVVSTANNHSIDRFKNGADLTVDELNRAGLKFTGTRKQNTEGSYYTITRTRAARGQVFRLAWVACTFSYNGIADRGNQVLNCYNFNSSGHPVLSQTNPEVLSIVRSLSSQRDIDGVIVTPHWGPTEYVHSVHPSQARLARELVDAGAIAIIGAHPHVLQPWETLSMNDGRKAFVHYSLGNFVSNQSQAPRRASMVLALGMQKVNGKLQLDGVRYIPTYLNQSRWGGTQRYSRELTPLNRNGRHTNAGNESLRNILTYFPDEARLDSTERLTTCN